MRHNLQSFQIFVPAQAQDTRDIHVTIAVYADSVTYTTYDTAAAVTAGYATLSAVYYDSATYSTYVTASAVTAGYPTTAVYANDATAYADAGCVAAAVYADVIYTYVVVAAAAYVW